MISRRKFLSGLTTVGVSTFHQNLASHAEQGNSNLIPRKKRPALQLRPPRLHNPKILNITAKDAARSNSFDLYGNGSDWIVNLVEPIRNKVTIHGHNQARHIVLIGGEIVPDRHVDPSTMILGDDYAVYALRGFTGASGGTFRVGPLTSRGPFTQSLPYDVTPSGIKAAIEEVLGPGSCYGVTGSGIGGPWKIVPADTRLGRPGLDLSGLQGFPTPRPVVNVYNPAEGGIVLKHWTGTVHVEGLYVGGTYCIEGGNIQNQNDEAIAQFSNCHFEASYFQFHPDWHHGDGFQCYLGPTEFRAERCDFITRSTGSGFIGQPRETDIPAGLGGLRDWWFKSCYFAWRPNLDNPYIRKSFIGAPVIMEDDWPHNSINHGNWKWRMEDCYASRYDYDQNETIGASDLKYFSHFPHSVSDSLIGGKGIKLRATPDTGIFSSRELGECGFRYQTTGYSNNPVGSGLKRISGEKRI